MSFYKFRPGLREVAEFFFLLVDKIIPYLLKNVLPNQRLVAVLSFVPIVGLFFLVLRYYFPQREIFMIHTGYKEGRANYRSGGGTVMASLAVALPSLVLWLKWFKPDAIQLFAPGAPDTWLWLIFALTSCYAVILLLSHYFDGRLSVIITLWIVLSLGNFLLFSIYSSSSLIPFVLVFLFFIMYTILIKIALGQDR